MLNLEQQSRWKRPQRRFMDAVMEEMTGVTEVDARDRVSWRQMIHYIFMTSLP